MAVPLHAPPRARRLGRNLRATMASTFGRVAVGLAASIVVTRVLGPAGRGELSFVLTTLSLLVMLGGAGSFAAVSATSARYDRSAAQLYPASASLAAGIAVVVGAWFSLAYLGLRHSLFSGMSLLDVLAVLAALLPTLVLNYWTAVAALDDRLVSFSMGSLTGAVLYLLAVAIAAAADILTMGTALVLWILASLAPLATVMSWRRVLRGPGQRTIVGELLRHASRAHPGDLAMLLVLRVDVLAVKGHRGFTEVGLYAVATGIAELLLQAGSALRVAFLVKQGEATDRAALPSLLARSNRLLLWAGSLGVVVVALAARPLITLLFGPSFAGAGVAATILAPGVLAVALYGPLRDYLSVEGVTKVPTVTAVGTLVANIALNVILLQNHSYLVAAMTSTMAYGINFLVCAWCFGRLTRMPFRQLVIPERTDLLALRSLLRVRQ